MKSLSREELEAELVRLQALLAQGGIDARLTSRRRLADEARHLADLSISRAETAAARDEVRAARAATDSAAAELARSEALVAKLEASQARLTTVIETVPVGVLLADVPSGCILVVNARVEDLLGHPLAVEGGFDGCTGFHPDGRPVQAAEWPLARIVGGATDRAALDVHYERPDGSRTWIAVTGEAIKSEGGTSIGAVIAFRCIDDRKAAEASQDLLNRELSHRLKNTLAMVQSIATQTIRNASSLPAAQDSLSARLAALGKAHDVLLVGHAEGACVSAVVQGALALHDDTATRFRTSGPSLFIGPSAALMLALVLHELATNATKYGALSGAAGHVRVEWSVVGAGDAAEFRLAWTEQDGPPVTPPDRKGFGSRLIERGVGGSRVVIGYPPEGVTCTLRVPLAGFQFRA